MSSFGTLKNFKSHSRARSKSSYGRYGSHHYPYGQLNYFGPMASQPRQLRPMDQVMRKLPPRPLPVVLIQEPQVHLSPPSTIEPPTQSSFQTLKQLYLEEKAKNGELPSSSSGGEDFGTLVLAPPTGQDGRVANKPKALMTPFEKIRFGQADFGGAGGDDDLILNSKRGLFYYPIRASRVRDPPPPPVQTTTTTTTPRPSLPQAPIPSVFSFWRRQLLPQDPPSTLMVSLSSFFEPSNPIFCV